MMEKLLKSLVILTILGLTFVCHIHGAPSESASIINNIAVTSLQNDVQSTGLIDGVTVGIPCPPWFPPVWPCDNTTTTTIIPTENLKTTATTPKSNPTVTTTVTKSPMKTTIVTSTTVSNVTTKATSSVAPITIGRVDGVTVGIPCPPWFPQIWPCDKTTTTTTIPTEKPTTTATTPKSNQTTTTTTATTPKSNQTTTTTVTKSPTKTTIVTSTTVSNVTTKATSVAPTTVSPKPHPSKGSKWAWGSYFAGFFSSLGIVILAFLFYRFYWIKRNPTSSNYRQLVNDA